MYHHEGLQDSQSPKALKVSLQRDLKGITTDLFYGTGGIVLGFGFCNAATGTNHDKPSNPIQSRQFPARPQRP